MSDTINTTFVKILIQISTHKEEIIGWWLYLLTEEKRSFRIILLLSPDRPCRLVTRNSQVTQKCNDKKCRYCETFIKRKYEGVCSLESEMTFWHGTDLPQGSFETCRNS